MKLKVNKTQGLIRQALATGVAIPMALLVSACGGDTNSQPPALTAKNVTIKRDTSGVPHIYADDKYGVFYGYAYSLAEDRLFQ
ncbi:MAG: penicillin acylase family protein, partial [Noviherbaspirillum sp.]